MRWIRWLVAMSCVAMSLTAMAGDYMPGSGWMPVGNGQPTYSVPPLSVLQPRLIDQRYRIPTGEVESYRPVVPCNVIVIRTPVWVLIGWDYHPAFGVWTTRYQLTW